MGIECRWAGYVVPRFGSSIPLRPWLFPPYSLGFFPCVLPLDSSFHASLGLFSIVQVVSFQCQFHFSCNDPFSCPPMQRGRPSLLFLWLLHHSRVEIMDPPHYSVAYWSTYILSLMLQHLCRSSSYPFRVLVRDDENSPPCRLSWPL